MKKDQLCIYKDRVCKYVQWKSTGCSEDRDLEIWDEIQDIRTGQIYKVRNKNLISYEGKNEFKIKYLNDEIEKLKKQIQELKKEEQAISKVFNKLGL